MSQMVDRYMCIFKIRANVTAVSDTSPDM